MNRLLALAFCLLCTLPAAYAQGGRFRIMAYNVENLFDTIHATGHSDEDFTPQGSHRWTSPRYWGKLGRLAKVLAAVGGDVPVDLVALVEVENDSVLSHLTRRTNAAKLGYRYIVSHSQDARGINVALLYLPHRFRPVSVDTIRVFPTGKKTNPTRDVLHVAGELTSGDTLDVFVCHWPSRRGGKPANAYRMEVARAAKAAADSLFRIRQNPMVVLTGDFNSFYPEECLLEGLCVKLPSGSPPQPSALYLLSHGLRARQGITGTYKFQGQWNQLDHFIVSGTLLDPASGSPLHTTARDCLIVDFPFLLQALGKERNLYPFRTYGGTYYKGGYSDHLPLLLKLSE